MKEIIGQIIEKLEAIFLPKRVKQPETEKANGSTRKLQRFLTERFDFRHNQLTGVTEYRPKDEDAPFRPIDERNMNGMIVDARLEGIACWNSMVPTLVLSNKVESFNPFHLYMNELPEWDRKDRVIPLLQRVSDDEMWLRGGRYWLRAMAAQWMGEERCHANALMPILISGEQGLGKSTFCRQLLPDSLRGYYLDNLNLSPGTSPEKKLVRTGLINLDEFDRYSPRKQSTLKNLMQMTTLSIRRAYEKNASVLPRIASFIGTSNSDALLCDPTGSRRFLCVEITESIDVATPIEYEQLYAQCLHLLDNGERHHFTDDEVRDIELRNRGYRRSLPLEELFFAHYRLPREGEEPELLSAAEIYDHLYDLDPRTMRGVCRQNFGAELRSFGVVRRKHHERRVYGVKLRIEN